MARIDLPALVLVAIALAGCGREERGPLLAGGRPVASWVADLHSPKAQVRRQAVLKLGNVGDADPAAAEGLALALRDADPLVRREAIFAIMKLKAPQPAGLEEMSRTDSDPSLRELARRALEKLTARQ